MSFYNMKILKLKMDIPLIFPRAGPDPPDKSRARAEGRSWVWIARHLGRPSPDAARMMHVAARAALCKALRERGVLG